LVAIFRYSRFLLTPPSHDDRIPSPLKKKNGFILLSTFLALDFPNAPLEAFFLDRPLLLILRFLETGCRSIPLIHRGNKSSFPPPFNASSVSPSLFGSSFELVLRRLRTTMALSNCPSLVGTLFRNPSPTHDLFVLPKKPRDPPCASHLLMH